MSKEIKEVQAQIGGTRPREITPEGAQTPLLWRKAVVLHPQARQTALDWTRAMSLPRGNTPERENPETPRNTGF